MVDSNSDNPMDNGPLAALQERLAGHVAFGESGTVGARLGAFADRRVSGHRRLWRPGRASYALGAREMAVEVGLRYLPLAADPEFLPVHGYEDRELYPAHWQNWLNADLLRLFEDEEEELLAQAWLSATAARAVQRRAAVQRQVLSQQPRRPRPITAAVAGSPMQRRASKIAQLTERIERVAGAVARPLQQATRSRALQLAPRDVAEMVTVTAAALDESLPPERRFAALPAAPARQPAVLTRVMAEQVRSPYPASVGRAATFSHLIASKPSVSSPLAPAAERRPVRRMVDHETDQVLILPAHGPQAISTRADDEPRPAGGRAPAVITGPPLAASMDRPERRLLSSLAPVDTWLDDVGLDADLLPALSGGLSQLVAQAKRVASAVSLVADPESGRTQLLARLEARTSGERTGLPAAAAESMSWRRRLVEPTASRLAAAAPPLSTLVQVVDEESPRPIVPGAERAAPAAITSPPAASPASARRFAAAARAQTLARTLEASRDSLRLTGLTSYDPDPGAPASDTRVAMRPAAMAQRMVGPEAPSATHFALADLAPRTVDAAPPAGRRSLAAAAAPAPRARVAPSERSWQLFSPAKALSLSMMLAGSEDEPATDTADASSIAGSAAARLAVVLTEGRRALADWQTEATERPGTRALTPFGSVGLETRAGGVRAMRVDPAARGPVVQLYSEAPRALDTTAQRAQASRQLTPRVGGQVVPALAAAAAPPTLVAQPALGFDGASAPTLATAAPLVTLPPVTTPAVRQAMARRTFADPDLAAGPAVQRPRVLAAQEPGRTSLPTALRPALQLLRGVPQAARRSVTPGETVSLPAQVALPGALMRTLRERFTGIAREQRPKVLAVLESPEAFASEARRPMQGVSRTDRVLLLSVEERTAQQTPSMEQARPLAPIRPLAAAVAPTTTPMVERVAAPRADVVSRAPDGLPAASYAALTQQQRSQLRSLSPTQVRELVAAGRLAPEAAEWVRTVAPVGAAVDWPALGSFRLDESLGGVPALATRPLELARADFGTAPVTLRLPAASPMSMAEADERVERWAEQRPSVLARQAARPQYVTISDEVAHAAPLSTEVGRVSLMSLARVEPRVAPVVGLPSFVTATGVQPAPAAAAPRGRWAAGVLARTEGFAEQALGRVEGRSRSALTAVAERTLAAGAPGAPEAATPAVMRTVGGRLPEPTMSLLSLPPEQAEAIAARLGPGYQPPEQTVRTMRLARRDAATPVVALAPKRRELTGISEPMAAQTAARALGLAVEAPPAPSAAPAVPSRVVTAARLAREVVEAAGPVATPPRPSVATALAAPAPAPISAPSGAAPRRIEPQIAARAQRGVAQVSHRAMATVRREAEAELRRQGMTRGRIRQLTGWTPQTVAAMSRPLVPSAEQAEQGVPAWASSLLDLTSPATVAGGAPGVERAGGLGRRVREALVGLFGRGRRSDVPALQTSAEAGLPDFESIGSRVGARRPSEAALKAPSTSALVGPSTSSAVRPVRTTTRPGDRASASATQVSAARERQAGSTWTALRDLTGEAFSAIADASLGAAEPRIGPTPNLRWLQQELSTLIQASSDARMAKTLREPIQPRASETTRTMLAYLDAQEEPKEAPSIPGLALPAGAAGTLVSPKAPVPKGRTRLQPKPTTQRAIRHDRVQGEDTAGPRQYVAPTIGVPRAPDISLQPLAAKGGGQSSGADGDRGEVAPQGAVPPLDKLELMAEEVWVIIQDREELETDRLGG